MNTMVSRRLFTFLLGFAGMASVTGAHSASLPIAPANAILVVSGKIKNVNQGAQASLDRQMIEAIGMETIVTKTPWYKDAERFEGVRLSRLMDYLGAFGDRVLISALNDYTSEVPLSDFSQYGTLLALKRNGAYLPISDKGPLFVIYPFDENPELRQDKFYMRSVWQISTMEVR